MPENRERLQGTTRVGHCEHCRPRRVELRPDQRERDKLVREFVIGWARENGYVVGENGNRLYLGQTQR